MYRQERTNRSTINSSSIAINIATLHRSSCSLVWGLGFVTRIIGPRPVCGNGLLPQAACLNFMVIIKLGGFRSVIRFACKRMPLRLNASGGLEDVLDGITGMVKVAFGTGHTVSLNSLSASQHQLMLSPLARCCNSTVDPSDLYLLRNPILP